MKILNVISQRPDSTGSGIYLQEVMSQAASVGHLNYLVCGIDGDLPALPGIEPSRIAPVRFATDDNPGAIVGMSDVMPYPSRTFGSLEAADIDRYLEVFSTAIKPVLDEFVPDLIHGHHLWLVGSILKELAPSIPVSLSCHGSDLRQFSQCPTLRRRVSEGCRKVDHIFCLTAVQKKEISSLYRIDAKRIDIVGAGYNQTIFNCRARPRQAGRPCTIAYAGKLSRANGVSWLLRALRQLLSYPFQLHLAGSGHGPEYQQCVDEAKQLGDRVIFHGPLDQQELAAVMRSSDLFVLPSLFEGLPLVVLEALACGCRVIATDLPGCRDIAAHLELGGGEITLVPAPTVIDTATTQIDDERQFIDLLHSCLASFLDGHAVGGGRPPSISGLDYYSWSAVFRRLEARWSEMISSYRHP